MKQEERNNSQGELWIWIFFLILSSIIFRNSICALCKLLYFCIINTKIDFPLHLLRTIGAFWLIFIAGSLLSLDHLLEWPDSSPEKGWYSLLFKSLSLFFKQTYKLRCYSSILIYSLLPFFILCCLWTDQTAILIWPKDSSKVLGENC